MGKINFCKRYNGRIPNGFESLARKLIRKITMTEMRDEPCLPARQGCELEISFVDDKEIRKLNKKFRRIDKATDVLSFEMNDDGILGDIVISVDSAKRNAKRFCVSLTVELKRLVVHGLLHLLGSDHMRKKDRMKMRAKEERYLLC